MVGDGNANISSGQRVLQLSLELGEKVGAGLLQDLIIKGGQKTSAMHILCNYPSACTNVARLQRRDLLSVASFAQSQARMRCNIGRPTISFEDLKRDKAQRSG